MTTTKKPTAEAAPTQTFEAALERLEALVKQLESGGLSLADSLTLFEEGVRLTRRLKTDLADAERRVTELLEGDAEKPFGGDEDLRGN
jgi:exodeoxyribonuclease VII small subunit